MTLYMPTKIFSQPGCVLAQAREIAALGTKAMIVTGHNSARRNGALADMTAALEDQGLSWILFDRVEENPSIETVMQARDIALAEGVDLLIGIGGGSPMDAAKAIALMAANPQVGQEVLYQPVKLSHLPVVCVPTTCGTGSEVTPYAILTRHALRTKKSISHRIYPALALLDSRYLRHMSRQGLVDTAVDALAHLLESWLNTNTDALTRLYTREGLLLWASFRDALAADALTDTHYDAMLHASMAAGMAITHTGTSLPHGMSYPVTYELGIPHGRAVGMFLGGFVETWPDAADAQEAVNLLGFDSAAQLHSYLRRLLGAVEVPEMLLARSADAIAADPGKLKNYPVPITREAMMAMAN